MELAKVKDELAKAKSESEVTMLKCFDVFLKECASTLAHARREMLQLWDVGCMYQ